jgi:hypothetical protein
MAIRKTLSAAPIRAPGVKRAYGSGPVTARAAGLGQLFFWILPRSCPGLPAARPGVRAGAPAAAQRRGRTSLTPASGGRSLRARKGPVAIGLSGVACWFPALVCGVVSQAPIRRRARARLP